MTLPRRAAGVSTAAVLLAAGAVQLMPFTPATQAVSDSLQLALVIVCCAAAADASRRESGEGRWFWLAVAAATGLWGAGQVRYMAPGSSFYTDVDVLQDVLFLGVALPFLPALALQPDDSRESRARLAFDVAIVGVLAAFLYVYIALSFPALSDPAAYSRWRIGANWVLSLSVVIGFVLRWRSGVPPWRRLYAWLGSAVAVWLAGDAVLTGVMLGNAYRPGLLDLPWLLPFAWITLLALNWQPPARSAVSRRPVGWRDTKYGAVIALAGVAAPALVHFGLWLGANADAAEWRGRTITTLVTSLAVAGLFFMRQITMLDAFEQSERRRVSLRRSAEERFSRAFHGVPLGAAILNASDGHVVDINDRARDRLGWDRTSGGPRRVDSPDTQFEGAALQSEAAMRQWRGRAMRLRRVSGELIDVRSWLQPLEPAGERSVLVLLQDQRETRRLETQLIQAQKAEAVGRLAGSVAHDLNNLLTAIVGSTEVARQHLDQPIALDTDLEHVVSAADRAASLTGRLLEYGHGQAESPQVIDVGSAVRQAERTVRQLAGDAVETLLVVPDTPLLVRIEPGEFERILVNLVVNARDAMNGGGRLTIALEPEVVATDRELQETLRAGRVVTLTVRDTGEGISPSLLSRVFEPFFTTKAAGEGSGLGLATVRDTAQRFGGAVSLASTPGVGTTVTVRLPAADDAPQPEPAAKVSVRPESGHETVLLVEDEDAVREVVRRVLERQGYRVIEASSGPRALALAANWPHPIDLLLTDVIMPDMNGPQLAAQLSGLRPGIRILYASGYAADALGPMGLGSRDVAIIQKPFTPSELAQRVRQALDEN